MPCKWEYFSRNLYELCASVCAHYYQYKAFMEPIAKICYLKEILPRIMKVFVIMYIEWMFIKYQSIYDTSQVLIMIWLSVHRIMTINFIGCVITLIIPSSLAMFTFKKIYLKFYLLCLVEVSLNPPSPPQKKSMQKSNTFLYYFMLCKINRLGSIILSS